MFSVDFYPCIFGGELPIDFGILSLSGFLPSEHLFFYLGDVVNPSL